MANIKAKLRHKRGRGRSDQAYRVIREFDSEYPGDPVGFLVKLMNYRGGSDGQAGR